MTEQEHLDKATQLVVNYLEAISKAAGFRWDADYTAEVREALEHVADAAAEKLRPQLVTIHGRTEELLRAVADVKQLVERRFGKTEHEQAVAQLRESAQPCGCDPAAGWKCERHRLEPLDPRD